MAWIFSRLVGKDRRVVRRLTGLGPTLLGREDERSDLGLVDQISLECRTQLEHGIPCELSRIDRDTMKQITKSEKPDA